MCWPRVEEANPLFSVCITLCRWTATARLSMPLNDRGISVYVPWCPLLVIQKLRSLSMFQTKFLPHQHGWSALDTNRTLFLLASTQGVSCRLVMNHLIYMYMFSLSPPLILDKVRSYICKSSPMIHCGNRNFLVVTWQMFEKWKSNGGIIGSEANSCCNGV